MSLASDWDAVAASCVHIPQFSVHTEYPDDFYQVSVVYSVNSAFWRTLFPVQLVMDAPSPPSRFFLDFYERKDTLPSTDPILHLGGFIASCSSPGLHLGTSRWFIMATLGVQFANNAGLVPDYIHIQNYKTNSGSIGLVRTGVLLP